MKEGVLYRMLRAQADWTFSLPTSRERAGPLAEKNAAGRHHVLRILISLHSEHRVYKVVPRIYKHMYKFSALLPGKIQRGVTFFF
jgi:hypothetical protein